MFVWLIIPETTLIELRKCNKIVLRTFEDCQRYTPDEAIEIGWFDPKETKYTPWLEVNPFHWVMQQFHERRPDINPEAQYPWMAYYQFNDKMKKPDMRTARHWLKEERSRGLRHALVKLEVKPEKVLLFDDDAWVMGPLGAHAVTYSEEEFNQIYGSLDDNTAWPPVNSREEILATWPRIFELDELVRKSSPDWNRFGIRIIALLAELDLDDVRSVKLYPIERLQFATPDSD